jgi:hypothetical protein
VQPVCDVLEALTREGVLQNYAIGGATAAGFHGEPLATMDIDVFVFLENAPGKVLVSLEPILKRLAEFGHDKFEEEALMIHGFPVQFLFPSSPLETEAVNQAVRVVWDGHQVRVMSPEYLAAIALAVGRPKDRARVIFLRALKSFNEGRFLEIIHRHQLASKWQEWAKALGLVE